MSPVNDLRSLEPVGRTGKRPGRLAAAVALAVLPLPVAAGELRLTVDGIRSSRGTVLIGLYDSPASFAKAVEGSAEGGLPRRVPPLPPQRGAGIS
jgi:hypothetical protein